MTWTTSAPQAPGVLNRVLVSCLVTAACAASPSRAYREQWATAQRAYAHGRYSEAAAAWDRAAHLAGDDSDRVEAMYRRAASLKRAGRWQHAADAYDKLLRTAPRSARAARAAYERALLELAHGDRARARDLFEQVPRDHPSSALASRAVDRALSLIADDTEKLAYLTLSVQREPGTELEEYARYRRARLLDTMGDIEGAYAEYLDLAARFPYPDGPHWDDSLWYAAQIDRRRGRYERAIALLDRMLLSRERSHFAGSYERSRYSEAAFRIAEIYRDDLHDRARARRRFERFYDEHRTSRMRDDAKWEEARLSRALGDTARACEAIGTLAADYPESRFVGCGPLLCPSMPPVPGKECHDYIARDLAVSPEAGDGARE